MVLAEHLSAPLISILGDGEGIARTAGMIEDYCHVARGAKGVGVILAEEPATTRKDLLLEFEEIPVFAIIAGRVH